MSRTTSPRIAVVGATGAVGVEFLRVLEQRGFPCSSIKLLASARSAGKKLNFKGQEVVVEELTAESFSDVDIALFSAGGSISEKYGSIAVEAGAVVVDNSSAFRMSDGVPLVIPEVNGDAIQEAGIGLGADKKAGIIANPNCSTILLLLAVTPLHLAAKIETMVVSTYQAASGAGAAAMAELELQTREVLEGKEPTCEIFSEQYAFNIFSHNAPIGGNGYNEEEMKMVHETHKIWKQLDLPVEEKCGITATCVRVPVMRAHAESVTMFFEQPVDEVEARAILANAPGVSIIDDREANRFPMPLDAQHKDDVFVGRIRQDLARQDRRGLSLFLCGDQIRKGAALNAVQIAELLLEK